MQRAWIPAAWNHTGGLGDKHKIALIKDVQKVIL